LADELVDQRRIPAVVVLSDGADTASQRGYDQVRRSLKFDPDDKPVMVFTIGYGQMADRRVLQGIAQATQAKFYTGEPATILKVLEDNAAFFGRGEVPAR
jgi:hypothetical protein